MAQNRDFVGDSIKGVQDNVRADVQRLKNATDVDFKSKSKQAWDTIRGLYSKGATKSVQAAETKVAGPKAAPKITAKKKTARKRVVAKR